MTDLVIISVAIYVGDTDWPLNSAGRQNFVMPVSAVLSAAGNSVSALNTVATANTANNYFVNVPTDTAVLLVADARPASNVILPNDATITVDDTTLTVTGEMGVTPGSAITSIDGTGTIVYKGGTTLPTSNIFASTWTGTVEISGATLGSGSIANLGNANSTIELAGDGLTIDTLSANMTFAGALTGDGTLNVTATPSTQYTTQFTGNCTAFAGSVTIATSGKARVAFGNNNIAGNNNCLVVGSDATVTVASGKTWTAPGGFVIKGNMTLSGNLGGGEKVYGDTGVITVTSDSARTNLTIASSWTGTVKIAYNPGNNRFVVNDFGSNANATVEIVGADGAFGAFPCTAWANGTAPSITPIVKLSTTWTIANGWDNATTTFSKLTGTGNLIVNGTTSSDKAIPYTITRIENFTGAIGGNRGQFKIGTVVSGAEPTVGAKIVNLSNCTKDLSSLANTLVVYNNTSYYGVVLEKQTDGLYVTEAATVGGESYVTLADAIDAASAGDTITLSRTIYAETINITKNLTINRNGIALNADSFNIASDATLTFTGSSKQIKAAAFTGGGKIVATNSLRLCPSDASGTSNIDSIDVTGNLSFDSGSQGTFNVASVTASGTFAIDGASKSITSPIYDRECALSLIVSGNLTVSGAMTNNVANTTVSGTLSAASLAIDTSANQVAPGKSTVTAGTLSAPVSGSGKVVTTSGDVLFSGNGQFTGAIRPAEKAIFAANSSFSLFGTNVVDSALALREGATITLASPLSIATLYYDFDASATDAIVYDEESKAIGVTNAVAGSSIKAITNATELVVTTDVFTDMTCVTNSKLALITAPGVAKKCNATFLVWRRNEAVASGETYSSVMGTENKYYVQTGAKGYNAYRVQNNGSWHDWCVAANGAFTKAGNAIGGERKAGENQLIFVSSGEWQRYSNDEIVFGGSKGAAFGEALAFEEYLSKDERQAIEAYLMAKWGIIETAYSPFASTAEIELASGATLDLGGLTQTVASFTGGGTVQNGTLLTTSNVYTNNGALAIAAVDNMTVVLDAGATALTLTGDATGVKLTATDAFLASGGTVTVTATGIYDASHTIDISEIPSTIFRFGATDNEDGTLTIGAATSGFTAATYTWSPVGSSTDWTSLANWSVSGYSSVAVLPQEVDTVVFPASEEEGFTGWTVALDAAKTVASATFNADVTLSGAVLFSSGYTGSGTITLGDDAGLGNNETEVTITNDIVVAGTGSHTNILYSYKDDLTVSGGLSGAGNLELRAQYDKQGVTLSGANTMTSGSITAKSALGAASGSGRRNCSKVKAIATNAALVWQLSIGTTGKSGNDWAFFQDSNATYHFGSIGSSSIGVGGYVSACVYEIGALGYDDTLSGGLTYKDRWSDANTLKKVGDGDLSVTISYVNSYDVNAGTLTLKSDNSRPYDSGSIVFTGTGTLVLDDAFTVDVSTNIAAGVSTAPIKVDTGTVAREWEVEIPANSASALVKSGAGTLTLSAAPLAATFEISVEAGKVVVPNTATNTKPAKGTKCEEVGETLEYTKGPEIATGDTTNVEGLADQDKADAVAATYNVTLTDAQVTQGLETSYYKVVATQVGETTTYNMSVVLDEAEVGVDFGEEGDTVEPVVFTGSAPTFQLKECVKKGLYYSVGTITDPTAANPSVTVLAEQQATADGEEISLTPTLNFGAGNVIYYKLSVSDTAQTP